MYSSMAIPKEAEMEIADAVRKAVSSDETAPKQKHVRSCIVFAFEYKTTKPIWNALKLQPILSDEVQCFKALVLIHKMVTGGPKIAIQDAQEETSFFDNCNRYANFGSGSGYGPLIRAYVQYLQNKLDFHRTHPAFTGAFDFQEYQSLKRVNDPNEGYLVISDLMTLQAKLDNFQKTVFSNFRPSHHNECRISSLVPIIEESYGMYKFQTSMLTAMFKALDESVEVLFPLQEQYITHYRNLKRFYDECTNVKYLATLITIPTLPNEPPSLAGTSRMPSRTTSKADISEQQQPSVPSVDHENMQLMELKNQVNQYHHQLEHAQRGIMQYQMRVQALENELNATRLQVTDYAANQDNFIRSLQEQINVWKSKYEAMAKMYQGLRSEHIELLKKYQEALKNAGSKETITKLQEELKAKTAAHVSLQGEKNQLKSELERAKENHSEELARLRRDVAESKARVSEMASSKGSEYDNLVKKFNMEKSMLEELNMQKLRELEEAKKALEKARSDLTSMLAEKDEEISILKASLDQAIITMGQQQTQSSETEKSLQNVIDQMKIDHSAEMNKILDNVMENCSRKIRIAIDSLDDPNDLGNQMATPQYTITIGEKVANAGRDFSLGFAKFLNGDNQVEAINTATNLATLSEQYVSDVKGVLRLLDSDDAIDKVTQAVQKLAHFTMKDIFQNLQFKSLQQVEPSKRQEIVLSSVAAFNNNLDGVQKLVDAMVGQQANTVGDDIADIVEKEMGNAARAIQDALARLDSLIKAPKEPQITMSQKSVHDAILESTMAIMNAIGNLIKCATESQKEIVAHGKGSGSPSSFYKKNSRWTEGLISAAKSVALSTSVLVESADGVVHGTHSMEQLIVASHEVAACTAQLVAAARVKAVANSKTQEKLESAAKTVSEATKLLVRSAKQYSEQEASTNMSASNLTTDLSKLSLQQYKVLEMNQQVEILSLEKHLAQARKKLSDMRKVSYHKGNEEIK